MHSKPCPVCCIDTHSWHHHQCFFRQPLFFPYIFRKYALSYIFPNMTVSQKSSQGFPNMFRKSGTKTFTDKNTDALPCRINSIKRFKAHYNVITEEQTSGLSLNFCHAMLCTCGLCCHAVSVCLSVTFVNSVKTNKRIFKIFSPSGNQTTTVNFLYQTSWQYSNGESLNTPNGGVECRSGRRFLVNIWLQLQYIQLWRTVASCLH